jgi:hypothetical protein
VEAVAWALTLLELLDEREYRVGIPDVRFDEGKRTRCEARGFAESQLV